MLKRNFFVMLFMALLVCNCKNMSVIADKSEKPDKKETAPIFEIWKEVRGSVGVEGETLLFRLLDNGMVEFDQEIERRREFMPPVLDFFIQRKCPTPLSENTFHKLTLILKSLAESDELKEEYKQITKPFDISSKFTIVYKKDGVNRKIIINESEETILTSDQNRFPPSLTKLINEVYFIRENLSKIQEDKKMIVD